MDFAADAVFDVVAPPSRPANARSAPARDASEPTFDDHLEAATAEEEPAKPSTDAKANDSTERASSDDAPVEAEPAALPTEPPAPPHIVQIVAAPAPAPAPVVSDAASVDAPAPTAPIEASAPQSPQAPAAPASAPQPTPASNDDSVAAAPTESKTAAPAKSAPETAPQSDATPDAPVTNAAPQTSAPAAPQTAPTPPPAPTAEMPPPDIANVAVQPVLVERQTLAPQRPGKSEPQRGAKPVDAPSGENASAQPANAPQTQKSAPISIANKDAASSLLALQTDAPEIPAPAAQQSATPFAQPAAQSHQSAAVDHTAAARAAPAAAQVAREIIRRFDGENTRFELRLDPAELGRVEVRLDVSRDHRVTAVITADSPQALTELARHARELEQMLNSSGLQLSDSGLSFDLRQGGEGADADETRSGARTADGGDDAQQQIPTAARPLGFERWRGVRVDVTV